MEDSDLEYERFIKKWTKKWFEPTKGRWAAQLLDQEGRRVNYEYGWIKDALPKVRTQLKAEGIDMTEEQIRRARSNYPTSSRK